MSKRDGGAGAGDPNEELLLLPPDREESDEEISLHVSFSGITLTSMLMQFLGGSIFGYNTGVIAGALDPLDKTFGLSTTMQQVITAAILAGAMAGSISSGALADLFGRRRLTILFSLISIVGVGLLSSAMSIIPLIIARVILGLAVGGFSFVCPLYASETAPAAIRGILIAVIQLSIVFSAFFGYLMNLIFQDVPDGWRYMFAVGGIPCVILFFLSTFYMPESPRWLILHGREDEARPVLAQIVGEKNVDTEIDTVKESALIAQRNSKSSGWSEVFSRHLFQHFFLGFILCISNQMTGNNAVTYYAPKIFEQAGWDSGLVSVGFTAGVGFWKLIAMSSVLYFKLFDKYGRRTLILLGLSVMGTGAALLAISFFVFKDETLSIIATFCIFIFVTGFQMGPGPLFYVLCSEIFPDSVRGRAMSLVNAVQWSFNLLLSLFFVSVMESIGGGPTFLIFTGTCGFSALMLFFLCPETKGKTLDEVQTLMSNECKQKI
uniref:MFS transporter n=1 Tax=Hirondellea gigas TaxID=1518452 RepID=A0A6A7G7P3_9CRUS